MDALNQFCFLSTMAVSCGGRGVRCKVEERSFRRWKRTRRRWKGATSAVQFELHNRERNTNRTSPCKKLFFKFFSAKLLFCWPLLSYYVYTSSLFLSSVFFFSSDGLRRAAGEAAARYEEKRARGDRGDVAHE